MLQVVVVVEEVVEKTLFKVMFCSSKWMCCWQWSLEEVIKELATKN